jgi:ABC-type transport system involved in multi-copper enzyme maturation permease subunit
MAGLPGAASPGLLSSTLRVFDLSLGQLLWSQRSLLLALLVAAPPLLGALLRSVATAELGVRGLPYGALVNDTGGAALFGGMIWIFYIRFIVPVLGVFHGTGLIADEVDDGTITYLFCRPIRRSAVLLGKYLAYLACTSLLVLPSVVLLYFLVIPIGDGDVGAAFPALVADLAVLALGLAAYGALFAWVGSRLKRPLVIGLVFTFAWEPLVLLFPGYARRLTVAYYLQALVPHAQPSDDRISLLVEFLQEPVSVGASLAALAAITFGALWAASRVVENREYIIEP